MLSLGPLHYNLEQEGFTIGIQLSVEESRNSNLLDSSKTKQKTAHSAITDKGRAYLAGNLDLKNWKIQKTITNLCI